MSEDRRERSEPPEWFVGLSPIIKRIAVRGGAPESWLGRQSSYQPDWVTHGQEWRSLGFAAGWSGLGPSYLYGMYERAARAGWVTAPPGSEEWTFAGRMNNSERQYMTWAMHPNTSARAPTAWQQYGGQQAQASRAYWSFQQDDWTRMQEAWGGWRVWSVISGKDTMVRALGYGPVNAIQRLWGGQEVAPYMQGLPRERAMMTSGWWMGQPQTMGDMLSSSLMEWTFAQQGLNTARSAGQALMRGDLRSAAGAAWANARTGLGIQMMQPWLDTTMTNLSALAVRQMWGQPLSQDELWQMNQTNAVAYTAFSIGAAALRSPSVSGRDWKDQTAMGRFLEQNVTQTPKDVLWESVVGGGWGYAQRGARIGGFFVGQALTEKAYEMMGYPFGKELTSTYGFIGGQIGAGLASMGVRELAWQYAKGVISKPDVPSLGLMTQPAYQQLGRAFSPLAGEDIGSALGWGKYVRANLAGWGPQEAVLQATKIPVAYGGQTTAFMPGNWPGYLQRRMPLDEFTRVFGQTETMPSLMGPSAYLQPLPPAQVFDPNVTALGQNVGPWSMQTTKPFGMMAPEALPSTTMQPSLWDKITGNQVARGAWEIGKKFVIPAAVGYGVGLLPRVLGGITKTEYGPQWRGLAPPTEFSEQWAMYADPTANVLTYAALNYKSAIALAKTISEVGWKTAIGGVTGGLLGQIPVILLTMLTYESLKGYMDMAQMYPEETHYAQRLYEGQWAQYQLMGDLPGENKPGFLPTPIHETVQDMVTEKRTRWEDQKKELDRIRNEIKGLSDKYSVESALVRGAPYFGLTPLLGETAGAWKTSGGQYYLPGKYGSLYGGEWIDVKGEPRWMQNWAPGVSDTLYKNLFNGIYGLQKPERDLTNDDLRKLGLSDDMISTYRFDSKDYTRSTLISAVSDKQGRLTFDPLAIYGPYHEEMSKLYEAEMFALNYFTPEAKARRELEKRIDERFSETMAPYSFLEAAPWGGYFKGRGFGRTQYYTGRVAGSDLIRGMIEEALGRGLGSEGSRIGTTNTWEALARAGVPSGVQGLMRASGWYGMGERLMQQADVQAGRRETYGGVTGVSDAYAASVWASTIKEFMAGGTPWGYSAQPESFRDLGMLTAAAGVPFFGDVGRGFVTPTFGPSGTTYQYASGLHMYAHAVWTGIMTAKDAVREFKAKAPGVWQITEDDILSLVDTFSKGQKWPGQEMATPGGLIKPEMWGTGTPIPIKDPKAMPKEGYSFYEGGQAFYIDPISGQAGVTAFSASVKSYQMQEQLLAQTYGGAYGWGTKDKLDKALSQGLFAGNMGLYYKLVGDISYGVITDPRAERPYGITVRDPVTGKNVQVGTPGGWGIQGQRGDRGYGLVTMGGQAFLTYGNEVRGLANVSLIESRGAGWTATTTFDPRSDVGWTKDVLGRTVFSQGGWVIDRPAAHFPGANVMNMRGAPREYGYGKDDPFIDYSSFGLYGAPMFDALGNTYNPNISGAYQYNAPSGQSREDYEYWSERDKVTGPGPAMVLQCGLSRLVTKPTRALFAERGAEVVTVRPAGFDSTQTATSMRADTSRARPAISMDDVASEVSQRQAKNLRRARTARGA